MDLLGQIKDIQNELLLEEDIFEELLQNKLVDIKSSDDIGFKSLERISSYLGLTLTEFITKQYDLNEIKKQFIKSDADIPDNYSLVPGTFVSTIKGVADFLESLLNTKARKTFLEQMDISEEMLRDDSLLLNANALLKAGKIIKELNLSKKEVEYMAIKINQNSKRSPLQDLIKDCKDDYEVAKKLIDKANNHYDQNFRYKVFKDGENFLIEGKSNEIIHDNLKLKEICDDVFTQFKAYTVANATNKTFHRQMNLITTENIVTHNRQIQRFYFKNQLTKLPVKLQ